MLDPLLIELSRMQFAFTAMFHFLFVPLTIGLVWILVIMESVYVMTGKQIYKDMTKFWGKLFGINFALGVASGLTMEFQFGMNWAYYSHYVGDVFGAPLAIEGLMAFFLESTFVGLFFLGWDRLTRVQHLMATFLTALGTSLSALWILIANGWMQYPIGAEFNPETMRMELTSFSQLFFSPVAQVKFIHTLSAGYVCGSMFVLGISSWYILKKRDLGFARRSFAIAAGFGLAAICSAILLGDESGYAVGDVQATKLAAIEGEWETHEPPAAFTLFGFPSNEDQATHAAVKIPYIMGLVATRSTDEPVVGLKDLIRDHEGRIRAGLVGYRSLEAIRSGDATPDDQELFEMFKNDIGYALLLKRYTTKVIDATDEQIEMAARDSIPPVAPVFWAFRFMVGSALIMFVIFVSAFYLNAVRRVESNRWVLRAALLAIPLPWIAIESGWVVAEVGRQPWAIGEVLPVFLGVSSITVSQVLTSLISFVAIYAVLAAIEIYLVLKVVRQGPSSLGTGRYHFERTGAATLASQPQAAQD